MKIQLFFWLLLVLYCHGALIPNRPTHFIFGIQLKCSYPKPFKYFITIWEDDTASDDRVTDGYQGEASNGDFIYIRGRQYGDLDSDYELYAEIYHTCTHDGSSMLIRERKLGDALTENGLEYIESVITLSDIGVGVYFNWPKLN